MELAISSILDAASFSDIGGVSPVGDRSDPRENATSGLARVGSVGVGSDGCEGDSLDGGDNDAVSSVEMIEFCGMQK